MSSSRLNFVLPAAIVVSVAIFSFAYATANRYELVAGGDLGGYVIDTWTKNVFHANGMRYQGNLGNLSEHIQACHEYSNRIKTADVNRIDDTNLFRYDQKCRDVLLPKATRIE